VLHQFFPRHITGTETYTYGLAKSLQKRGHQVAVLCYEHSHFEGIPSQGIIDDTYDGIPVRRLCYHQKLAPNPVYYEYYNPLMGEWAQAYFSEIKPDVIHFTHCAFLTSAVIEAAYRLKIPTVLTLTDFWFICPRMQLLQDNGELCEGPQEEADCLKCYLPSLLSPYKKYLQFLPPTAQRALFHMGFFMRAILALNRSPYYGALKAALQRKLFLQQMLEKVNTIIAPSRFLRELYIKNGLSASALNYVPFGLDTSHLNGHKKAPSDLLRIAFIGTLTAHKGCHVLVEAFTEIESDRLRLSIYGNTEQFADYTARIKKQIGEDERIALSGTFPPEALGRVFSEIDILVVPSIWYENTPLIVYSALATKTPVIATNLGGLAELIKPGVNGFLFEAGDVAGLKACIEKIISSPGLINRLGEQIEPVKNMEAHTEEILQEYRLIGFRSAEC